MKRELTPEQRSQKRRLMWWGLGWGYLVMLFLPFTNWLLWDEPLNLSAVNIVLQLLIWSLAGWGMGRWLQWRAGLIGKRYVNHKNVNHDKI